MKFRKKPELVDAVQWNGENLPEVREFVDIDRLFTLPGNIVPIQTSEGPACLSVGYWLVKHARGTFSLYSPANMLKHFETFDFVPVRPSDLLKHCECFDFEFDGICGCCGFKEVPVKLMPDEKAYVCNVCLVEKTPQQRMVKYRENLEAKP